MDILRYIKNVIVVGKYELFDIVNTNVSRYHD